MSLDIGTLVAHIGLDISELTPATRAATTQLGQVEAAAAAVGGNLSVDKAIAGLAKLGQEGRRAQDLLNGPAAQIEHLAQATGKSVDELRTELSGAVTAARNAGVQIGNVGDQAAESGGKLDKLASKVADVFRDVSPALANSIEGLGSKGKLAGAALGAVFVASLTAAINVEPARKRIAAQLRLTPAEQKSINASASNLFKGNYAEDIGGANEVIRSVLGSFKELRTGSEAELTAIATKAATVASLMEVDIGTATRVAGQLVRNGLAKDVNEAFDLITAGSQNTAADMQGDLLEVVSEYTPAFTQLGINGSQAFKLISDASSDGPIFMDKYGDALKEFTIRATDMSASTVGAFATIGLDAQTMANDILAGGERANDAFRTIVTGLNGIKDPALKANTAIALFGTPIEDLGTQNIPRFLTQLQGMDSGLGDVAGRADEAAATNSSAASSFTSLFNSVKDAASSFGENLLPVLGPFVEILGGAVGVLGDTVGWFGALPEPIKAVGLALGGIAIVGLVGGFGAAGAAATALGTKMALLARQAAYLRGTGGMSGLAAAGTLAGRSLKGAGSAVLGAFGGPVGLAIAGVVTGIGLFVSSSQDAQAEAQKTRTQMDDLAGTMDKVSGAFTGATTAKLAEQLAEADGEFQKVGTTSGEVAALITNSAKDGGAGINQLREDIVKLSGISFDSFKLPVELDTFGRSLDRAKVSGAEWQEAIVEGGAKLDAVRAKFAAAGEDQGRITQAEAFYREELLKRSPALAAVDAAQGRTTQSSDETAASFKRLTDAAATKIGFDPTKLNEGLIAAAAQGLTTEQGLKNMGLTGEQVTTVLSILGDQAITSAGGTQTFAGATANAGAAAEEAEPPLSDMAQAMQDSADAATAAETSANLLDESLQRLSGSALDNETSQRANAAVFREIEAANRDVERAVTSRTEAEEKLTEITGRKTDADYTSAEKARDLREATLGVKDAEDNVKDAQDRRLDTQSKATAVAAAATDQTYQNVAAEKGHTAAVAAATRTMEGQRQKFIESQSAADQQSGAAGRLADKLGLIPANVKTYYESNVTQAAQDAEVIKAAFDRIPRVIKVDVQGNQSFQSGNYAGVLIGRAAGGAITGPGTGTSDDVLIAASNGEHMLTAADVVKLGGQQGVYRFRDELQKGAVPKYATGGAIGASAFSLAGNSAVSYSGRESVTRGALDDLLDAFKDLLDAAADAADEVRDTSKAYRDAKDELNKARHDRDAATSQARADIATEQADRARLTRERRNAQKVYDVADSKANTTRAELAKTADKKRRDVLNKALADQVKDARDKAKDLTAARADENEQIRKVAAAQRAFNQVRAEEGVKVQRASAAVTAASKADAAARVAKTRADAAAAERRRDLQATTAARAVLTGLARAADLAADKLGDARDRLDDLKKQSAQMASSVAGSIAKFGGGILGNSEQRQTGADVLRGLKFNESKVAGFGKNIDKLRGLGLSPALLEQIASAGVDGGGATATALAGSTPQMLREINATVARTNASAAKTGQSVADANFAKPIAGLTDTVSDLAAEVKGLQNLDDRIAREVRQSFELVGTTKALALLVAEGQKKIGRTG